MAGDNPNLISLFEELLEHKVPIEKELFAVFIREIVTHPYELDRMMTNFFIDYLVNRLNNEDKEPMMMEFKKGVKSLAHHLDQHESVRDALSCLLFSLVVIYLQEEVDVESENLFLRGLRAAFIQRYELRHPNSNDFSSARFSLHDVFNAIYPLYERIPHDTIHKIIVNGAGSDMVETASVCKILLALAKS